MILSCWFHVSFTNSASCPFTCRIWARRSGPNVLSRVFPGDCLSPGLSSFGELELCVEYDQKYSVCNIRAVRDEDMWLGVAQNIGVEFVVTLEAVAYVRKFWIDSVFRTGPHRQRRIISWHYSAMRTYVLESQFSERQKKS